jgi:hypothetical protein
MTSTYGLWKSVSRCYNDDLVCRAIRFSLDRPEEQQRRTCRDRTHEVEETRDAIDALKCVEKLARRRMVILESYHMCGHRERERETVLYEKEEISQQR